ncbi:phospholipase D-like domain-containing protein [Velocimicrobium porci]|uniref:Phospholipase D family protein n=1 Tax=Velocimicrobium porci TaxID=2606634 RepID=A0A6L5Y2Q1_9FIRM|nr:phospholipase D family protein [Velocimicrobium porci]MSS64638.1 phospholipase D family protein [Velocimicrobium porci]
MGKSIKTWLLRFLFIIGAVLFYEIVGALVPFVHTKSVSEEYKNSVSTEEFYQVDQVKDRAAVIETNQEALDVRLSMFEEAKESIVLSTFDMREGECTKEILASLVQAADRGVKVQILVDGMYGLLHMGGRSIFYAAGENKNIEIRFYNTPNLIAPWTMNGRMHDKYILIDNKLLLMGGRNTFDYFLGEYPNQSTGYDREVLVYHKSGKKEEQSAVTQVRKYFNGVWDRSECKTVFDKTPKWKEKDVIKWKEQFTAIYKNGKMDIVKWDYEKGTVPIEHASFVSNPTHIYSKEPYVWYRLSALMKQAKGKVLIQSPYAVFSQEMYDGMKEIAQNVPGSVLLINSVAVGDNFVASSDYIHNWEKVCDTNLVVKEYFGSWSSHGKSLLVDDDISAVGSYNFDMRSTYVDTETMLVIHGREFNKKLSKKISVMEKASLTRKKDGSYEKKDDVKKREISDNKRKLFWFTSRLIQPFRYLA